MGQWLCKQHGKKNHIPACIHLNQSVENGRFKEFKLVLEEISQVDSSYITSLICNDCAKELGIQNMATILFDPQIRKFEQDEYFDEEDAEYEEIFNKLDHGLVSICEECLLNIYPDFRAQILEYKIDAVEIAKIEVRKQS